jgi:hypothetical protein
VEAASYSLKLNGNRTTGVKAMTTKPKMACRSTSTTSIHRKTHGSEAGRFSSYFDWPCRILVS